MAHSVDLSYNMCTWYIYTWSVCPITYIADVAVFFLRHSNRIAKAQVSTSYICIRLFTCKSLVLSGCVCVCVRVCVCWGSKQDRLQNWREVNVSQVAMASDQVSKQASWSQANKVAVCVFLCSNDIGYIRSVRKHYYINFQIDVGKWWCSMFM